MRMSVRSYMTCRWNCVWPGNTFTSSPKANLHTTSIEPRWQCAYLTDPVQGMPLKICLSLLHTFNVSTTITAQSIHVLSNMSHSKGHCGSSKNPITWEEISKAVKKLKNAKAARLTGVPPEAFKAMSACNLCHINKHCNDFFLGTADHKQWHCSQCVPVPKSSNLLDPIKWRGVMLMDVCSKIFSSVMNGQAFRLLNKHGTCFQFGGTPELGSRWALCSQDPPHYEEES